MPKANRYAERMAGSLKYQQRARIYGTDCFPVDMLRYDNCHPATETDSGRIARSFATFGEARNEPWTVDVITHTEGASDTPWRETRWESFGDIHCVPMVRGLGGWQPDPAHPFVRQMEQPA